MISDVVKYNLKGNMLDAAAFFAIRPKAKR
jgi:hypothetical protein